MARQAGIQVENNFTKGLITENTALNFPENACTDAKNVVFDETGRVLCRGELDFEPGYVAQSVSFAADEAITEYLWTTATGSGEYSFIVMQKGTYLTFFDISTGIVASPGIFVSTVDMTPFAISGSTRTLNTEQCQYAQGDGKLFVTNRACTPFYVDYDPGTSTFTATAITVKYRDFLGLSYGSPSTYTDIYRPTFTVAGMMADATNGKAHFYNLLNQGWWQGTKTAGAPSATSALGQWDTARTDMPSNSDRVSSYRVDDTDPFDNARVDAYSQGYTLANKGHYILTLGVADRGAALAADGFTNVFSPSIPAANDITTEGVGCVAFFASRVWYAGVNSLFLSNTIYFSQVVERSDQYGKCYQVNDPTSEEFFDVLATDGGSIKIPEMGRCIRLLNYQSSLLVFATNGVWIIQGGNGGFSATDYTVRRISSLGTLSPLSFVDVKGLPLWWGETGILQVDYNPQFDSFSVSSVSDQTIKRFIQDIPTENKVYVKGAYDAYNSVVYWIYDSGATLVPYRYNAALCLNTLSGAFYPYEFSSADPYTADTAATRPSVRGLIYATDPIGADKPRIKFSVTMDFTLATQKLVWAQFKDPLNGDTGMTWTDWYQYSLVEGATLPGDGNFVPENYEAYFVTGHRFKGDVLRFFQANYISVVASYFNTAAENLQCSVLGKWDTHGNDVDFRSSSSQSIYNTASNYDTQFAFQRRLKIRGRGRSLKLRFNRASGKGFLIIGWSTKLSVNADV